MSNTLDDKLNAVQNLLNDYFTSIDSSAFAKFRADFSFGKMLRSKLLLTIAPHSPHSIKMCAIIELIHFASLLHDDVIDSSQLRRGKQSINAKYGDKNAIMIGDILYSKAFYEVAQLSQIVDVNLAKIIANAVFELSLGELDDVFLSESINLDAQKYIAMVGRKTGALIEASAVCGGILKNNASLTHNVFLGSHSTDLANMSLRENLQDSSGNLDSPSIASVDSLQKSPSHSTSWDLGGGSSLNCHFLQSEESKINQGDSSLQATLSDQNDKLKIDCHDLQSKSRNDGNNTHPLSHLSARDEESNVKLSAMEGKITESPRIREGEAVDCHNSTLYCENNSNNYSRPNCATKYRTYGYNLGIAFQIIDDLLDITQEDSMLGKESFSDFKEGKTTLPYIYLYNALNENDKAILKSYFKKSLDGVQKEWIRSKMAEHRIVEVIQNIAKDYGTKALLVLDSSDWSDKNLQKIIADMIDREF